MEFEYLSRIKCACGRTKMCWKYGRIETNPVTLTDELNIYGLCDECDPRGRWL